MAKLRQLKWYESGKRWRIEHGFTTTEWMMYVDWTCNDALRTSIVFAVTGFLCGYVFGGLISV